MFQDKTYKKYPICFKREVLNIPIKIKMQNVNKYSKVFTLESNLANVFVRESRYQPR